MDGVKMQITFCVDTEEFRTLTQKANQQSVSVSELVRAIVSEFLEKE